MQIDYFSLVCHSNTYKLVGDTASFYSRRSMDPFISKQDAAFAELDRRINEGKEAHSGIYKEAAAKSSLSKDVIMTVSTKGIVGLPASSSLIRTHIRATTLPNVSAVTILPQEDRIIIG